MGSGDIAPLILSLGTGYTGDRQLHIPTAIHPGDEPLVPKG
jgi:hypothetical protein